jgi:chromate transporter
MLVTFVGFCWRPGEGSIDPDAILASAFFAAVATFFTFLPSFIFILRGDRSSGPRMAT